MRPASLIASALARSSGPGPRSSSPEATLSRERDSESGSLESVASRSMTCFGLTSTLYLRLYASKAWYTRSRLVQSVSDSPGDRNIGGKVGQEQRGRELDAFDETADLQEPPTFVAVHGSVCPLL